MTDKASNTIGISTPIGRWAGIGPYYAMFPLDFSFHVVEQYSKPGDAILDPFAGRASSIYAAAALQRSGIGIEINPVGWLYGRVKLKPASKPRVIARIGELGQLASSVDQGTLDNLPEFFAVCYSSKVLRYLITARKELRWKQSTVDATVMAFLLIYLHGKQNQALSNQMRQGKSMSPDYSVRWWKNRDLTPPELDPVQFLNKRVEWRYAKGVPSLGQGCIHLGDSTIVLNRLARKRSEVPQRSFHLMFTSPPYYAITNYHYDQWLRLWMLGGPEHPTKALGIWQKKFESKIAYADLLKKVFEGCAKLLSDSATVYVRTDARDFTYKTTIRILKEVFPEKEVTIIPQPFTKSTQTALFGDKSQKPGEIDIILRP
jgi:hypothetical protein